MRKKKKTNDRGTDSYSSGWQHTNSTSLCFGREQSDLAVAKDALLIYIVMSSENT